MSSSRRGAFWRRTLYAILLGFTLVPGLSGCATWVNPGYAPATYVQHQSPKALHAYVTGGEMVIVWSPIVRNDSLFGLIPESAAPGYPLLTFARPLTTIDSIRVREVDLTSGVVAFGEVVATIAKPFVGPVVAAAWVFLLVGF